jgi:acetyl esterase/lipase
VSSAEIELVRELIELQAAQRAAPLAERRRQYDLAEQTFAKHSTSGETVDADGCAAEWVIPQQGPAQPVILYIHGGGYSLGSTCSHRHLATAIGRAANCAVVSLDYRRAPEHGFPAAIDDTTAATRWLLGCTGSHVILAGDSAGGGLVVATMIALRDAGHRLPAAGVCLSPWVDLTCTADAHTRLAERDPLLSHAELTRMAGAYLRNANPRNQLASPVFAELAGLPPLLIHAGTAEILLDDARKLARTARAGGVDVTFEEWPGMLHAWHWYFPFLSEGRQAISSIAAFVGRHATSTRPTIVSRPSRTIRAAPASLIQQAHMLIAPWTSGHGYLDWVYQLNGPLDTQALALAIDDVVRHHEILRVRFERRGERMHQLVTPYTPGNLELVDLTGHTKRNGLNAAIADVENVYRPLSPANDPRFRATLYTIAPKTSVLAMFVAEALVDSDSGSLLSAAISRSYAKHVGAAPPAELAEVSDGSHLDYIAAHPADPSAVSDCHEHWARQAQSSQSLSDWPTASTDGGIALATFSFQYSPADWSAVIALAHTLRTTPHVLTLTSLQIALARVATVTRLLVHTVVSQRTRAGVGLIGNFHGLARIDTHLDPCVTFAEAAADTAVAVADAIDHSVVPAPLTAHGALSLLPTGSPIPPIRFYMFAHRMGPVFPGIRRRRFRLHKPAPTPLTVSCYRGPRGTQDFALSSTTASHALLASLAASLRAIIDTAVHTPGVSVAALVDAQTNVSAPACAELPTWRDAAQRDPPRPKDQCR